MKKYIYLLLVCFYAAGVFAQQDPVVIRFGGKEVLRSEFERQYREYCAKAETKLSVKSYTELFINRQLAIAAAEAERLDTAHTFRQKLEEFQWRSSGFDPVGRQAADSCARVLYETMRTNVSSEQVQVRQIVRYLPQSVSPSTLRKEQARMDSVYLSILNRPDVDFSMLTERFSDDKQPRWLGFSQATSEVEQQAFSMQKGEVSPPFLSPEGIHILQVTDRRAFPPFEELRDSLLLRIVSGNRMLDAGTAGRVEQLKLAYHYQPDGAGVKELLKNGETDRLLFSLDGQAYTGEMFKRFARSNSESIKRQLEAFIAKSVLDCAYRKREQQHPPSQAGTLQQYRDELLEAEITHRKVDLPASTDRAGWIAYFKSHKSQFDWEHPRYKGVLLHCVDKETAKQARKLIRKLPPSEWADAVRKAFPASDGAKVLIEQGLFARGDNKYIDKLVFKEGDFEPIKSNPFTVVYGKKRKGPDEYTEVYEQLYERYRNYLATCWIGELRASGKVEINQEVLKTVNNL